MTDLQTRRDQLLTLKAELEQLQAMSEDARSTVTLDQQSVGRLSRMDAMQQQAMAKASEENRLVMLERIKAALVRINHDDYGYCLSCGDDIADKRLDIDPTATQCVSCASTQ
ncbi:TraR/DksA family transcriptional regulator [Coralliovum pocilloporae]|uniref:TraR/DksA family transcriptional regulator n=1 Tax=Coralliovum pocilloporae TaxID=3066369 RepID=UPI003306E3B0